MRKIVGSTAFVIATLVMIGSAGADLVQAPRDDFVEPAVAGFGTYLLPELINIPIDEELASIDCIDGDLTVRIIGNLSMNDPDYGIFWIGEGLAPLKVEAGVSNLGVVVDLYLIADHCLGGLVNGYIPFEDIGITINQFAIGFHSLPFLNTESNKIVLETDFGQSQVNFDIDELDLGLGFLNGIIEGVVEALVRDYVEETIFDQGVLADTGDGGAVHDVTEEFMNTIYLPNMCGCITVTAGPVSSGHLLANTALYMLPLGLILGLKRRMRRS